MSTIGAGGMDEVFLATDKRLDRQVAVKVLPAEFELDADRRRRFTREGRAAAALSHPNVAIIYDIGETEGISYIAMEDVEGRTSDGMTETTLAFDEIARTVPQTDCWRALGR